VLLWVFEACEKMEEFGRGDGKEWPGDFLVGKEGRQGEGEKKGGGEGEEEENKEGDKEEENEDDEEAAEEENGANLRRYGPKK
jgi:hypothetical protein